MGRNRWMYKRVSQRAFGHTVAFPRSLRVRIRLGYFVAAIAGELATT